MPVNATIFIQDVKQGFTQETVRKCMCMELDGVRVNEFGQCYGTHVVPTRIYDHGSRKRGQH